VGEVTRVDATLLRSLVNSSHVLIMLVTSSLTLQCHACLPACLLACFLALRFVGEVTRVDATLLHSLVNSGYVLVLMINPSFDMAMSCLPFCRQVCG
jgi:acetylglutamate kinase